MKPLQTRRSNGKVQGWRANRQRTATFMTFASARKHPRKKHTQQIRGGLHQGWQFLFCPQIIVKHYGARPRQDAAKRGHCLSLLVLANLLVEKCLKKKHCKVKRSGPCCQKAVVLASCVWLSEGSGQESGVKILGNIQGSLPRQNVDMIACLH